MAKGKTDNVLDDAVEAFAQLDFDQQQQYMESLQAIMANAKASKVAELMEALAKLGVSPPVAAKKKPAGTGEGKGNRTSPKPMYRTPDGWEWSGRGALPKAFKALGVTDKEGMEKYRIKE
jgi:DNA-binding protein H-NS